MWGWIAWIVVALAVWVAVAAFVGVLLGRAVRRRDRQVPDGDPVEVFPPARGSRGGPGARAAPAILISARF